MLAGYYWAFICLVACGIPSLVKGQESTQLAISVGGIADISVEFTIQNYEPGNREVIRVQKVSDTELTVTGVKEGRSDLRILGRGGASETYTVTVTSPMEAILAEIETDLEHIPEVRADISVGIGKVVLRGEVRKPRDWNYIVNTLIPTYDNYVQSLLRFRLQDDLLLELMTDLETAGFRVQEGRAGGNTPGVLSLYALENSVIIDGEVYSREKLDAVTSVVSACPWLILRGAEVPNENGVVYGVVNVRVKPVLLEVDISFLGVTDAEARTIGANLLRAGLVVGAGTAQIAQSTVNGVTRSGSYVVGTTMADTVSFIDGGPGVGPGRFRSEGHLLLKNDSPEFRVFHDGGTLKVPVAGPNTGVGLEDIDYGLILRAKGGLVDSSLAELDVNVELSIPVPSGNSAAGPIFDIQRSRLESTVRCPVGKTLIMAGTQQMTEGININSRTPILGQIPLLSFLFSEKSKSKTERKVLILISPHIAADPTDSQPLVDQTRGVDAQSRRPLRMRNY